MDYAFGEQAYETIDIETIQKRILLNVESVLLWKSGNSF
jgi:hypothetical protein